MNKPPSQNRSWFLPSILGAAFILLVIAGVCMMMVGAGIFYLANQSGSPETFLDQATSTPVIIRPTPSLTQTETESPGNIDKLDLEVDDFATPNPIVSDETYLVLKSAEIPENDPIELAQRLLGKTDIPLTLSPPPAPLPLKSRQTFWVGNNDTNEYSKMEAVLEFVTEHSYFWIEDGVPFDETELEFTALTFEEKIYPTVRSFFGSEWTPGVDGDPHLYIVFSRGLGDGIAGYYSSADEYHPDAKEFSNAHEMFWMSADILELGDEYTLTVLAHEFQHMIHWYTDFNEESWLNEGLSELASFINGYGVGYHDYAYIDDTDIQLTDWPDEDRTPHYGAAFLYLNYLLNRLGPGTMKQIVASPSNGLDSINEILQAEGLLDQLTMKPLTADQLVIDWMTASYLMDESVADGRYTYANYALAPQASATETISQCPTTWQTRAVSQYGADYIEITCRGDFELTFEGSVQVPLIPVDPYSGEYYFWSNRGDESDMTLTRSFDFREHEGPITLTYWTWFDIEKDYDYVYLESSIDDGATWELLITPSGTAEDPSGASYGWAYNGASGNRSEKGPENARWIQESVDLSHLAGEEALIRFEYITDPAVNGNGFVIDDIAVPETGYFANFEEDEGGWEPAGFVRIQNILPQTYELGIIRMGKETTVENFTLQHDNQVTVPVVIGDGINKVVLVITGTTPYTRQKTGYRYFNKVIIEF